MKEFLKKVTKDKYLLSIILISLVGIFLRFYHLGSFTTFLGDQGRDAIIIKRIITLEHFTALGPTTSIAQVYLGPFYYYFIAPWLFIFRFDPIGLAFGVAFFSSLYLLINYGIVKQLFNQKTALISTFLIAFSSILINFSRFSWNPNLLPLFTLLTVYFLIKALTTRRILFYLLTGAFLSFSVQLHYLALFLIVPTITTLIIQLIEVREKRRETIGKSFLILLSFLFFSLPLLIFDLRHQFLNAKNFINLFKSPSNVASDKYHSTIQTFFYLNKYVFNSDFNKVILLTILVLILITFLFLVKTKSNARIFLLIFILLFLGVSLYSGPKHAHYLGMIFPLYMILIAYFLSFLSFSFFGNIFILLFLVTFVFFNVKGYSFFWERGANQIDHAKKVASFLDKIIDNRRFNFAVQPDNWQEDTYLYFLELKGKRPVDRRKVEIADQMFVVCGKPCNLYRTPSWNITMFGNFKIVDEWRTEGVNIYKLIH